MGERESVVFDLDNNNTCYSRCDLTTWTGTCCIPYVAHADALCPALRILDPLVFTSCVPDSTARLAGAGRLWDRDRCVRKVSSQRVRRQQHRGHIYSTSVKENNL